MVGLGLGLAGAVGAAAQTDGRSALNVETFDFAWQRIADTFWDEEMAGVDWPAVAEELRPHAREAVGRSALRRVIQQMLERLGQSHFTVLPGPDSSAGRFELTGDEEGAADGCTAPLMRAVAGDAAAGADATPGFDVRFVDGVPLVSRVEPASAADRLGVVAGLELLRIGGQSLLPLERCLELDAVDPRFANLLRARAVLGLLEGLPGATVTVEFADGEGARRTLDLERAHPADATPVGAGNLPPMQFRFQSESVDVGAGRVLAVRFNVWMMPVIAAFERALYAGAEPVAGASTGDASVAAPFDGVLIDLRGNPGGVAGTAVGVAGYLLKERVELGVMKHRGSELKLLVYPRRTNLARRRIEPFEGPVAVITDGGSASTSEVFVAGLKDHGRVRQFGQPTAGLALPAVIETMPNGDLLMHAIADLERPNGERVEGRPVMPESLVPITRDGLLAGRDEPREAALEWLASELALHETAAPDSSELN